MPQLSTTVGYEERVGERDKATQDLRPHLEAGGRCQFFTKGKGRGCRNDNRTFSLGFIARAQVVLEETGNRLGSV